MHNMKKFILSLFVLSLVGTAAHAQKVDTLLTKKLPEAPGKEYAGNNRGDYCSTDDGGH